MSSTVKHYDVIVVGVGGMGSAATYHLAKRGLRVLALEQFNIPHSLGSSHGITRIIRLCYYEDPSYVPLLHRAFQLWKELQENVDERLLYETGSIDAGPEGALTFEGSLSSCRLHGLRHEVLNNRQLRERFPAYQLPNNLNSVYQADGGFLLPERCIISHVSAAQTLGAEVRAREEVLEWIPGPQGVRVVTDQGVYEAEQIVFSAGAWMGRLIKEMGRLTKVERQVLGWFQPLVKDIFLPKNFPVFNIQVPEGRFYGLPEFSVPGFKLGRYHHLNEVIAPQELSQVCTKEDEFVLRDFVAKYFPQGNGPTMALAPCMFTNTTDEHFIIDEHPQHSQVLLLSPCSGHGFKFCSVIGEIAADLVQSRTTQHDISLFRIRKERECGS
jgi:sarcosine oxidase